MRLQVIAAAARDKRAIEPVVSWVMSTAKRHCDITDVGLSDLRFQRHALFEEPRALRVGNANPTEARLRTLDRRTTRADAYIFVTGEYQRGDLSALSRAVNDLGDPEALRYKPAGFIGYGAGPAAGARAIERLELIALEMEMVPLHRSFLIPHVWRAFDPNSRPKEVGPIVALAGLIGDLVRWSRVLAPAREAGQLVPGAITFAERSHAS